ncbi:bucentaur or craniofacial development-domain-containing protein [Paraphoma chrysanthemicola]|uniref:SWR1-complex protein 5 n=1 Tax=Paraphoma chrysanthemicola TaxID=798071 RepID=A0A8K0QUS5_9PLEO|nr:bucentaur or craniofacial development-domain-containing protein [Paraphoma chrysanthemicola]
MPPLLVEYADYIEEQTDKYDESADEDFNPDSAPPEEASSSSDEDAAAPTQRKGKRKAPLDEELDSGDEVTIKAAKRKRAKKQRKAGKGGDEDAAFSDEDGEAGLIKTRAQRRVEKVEKKPLARTEGATVDVDALWAQMTATPLAPIQPPKPQDPTPTAQDEAAVPDAAPVPTDEEDQITISKTYTFAGQDTIEEKSIPRSHLSKYTSDGWTPKEAAKPAADDTDPTKHKANTSKIRRPLRRPSRFDPNPTGYVRALAPEYQLTYPRAPTGLNRATENVLMPPPELPNKGKEKTQKLNVVDKSRMDWTGFVDKEGIAEELDTHGKTKEAYLGRMEFLAGVEARREEERKKARIQGAAVGPGTT